MKKVLVLLALLVVVAVTAAPKDLIGADATEHLNEIDFIEMESKVDVSSKQHFVDRKSIRDELSTRWERTNLSYELFNEQELIEQSSEGSGYQEMGPIMKKVDELEEKINRNQSAANTKNDEDGATCRANKASFEAAITELRQRINADNFIIKSRKDDIKMSQLKVAASNEQIQKIEKIIIVLVQARETDTDAYNLRLSKRMNEIKTLRKANTLVCTAFAEFKDTAICKTVRNENIDAGETDQKVTEPLEALLKRSNDLATKLSAQAESNYAADKARIINNAPVADTKLKSEVFLFNGDLKHSVTHLVRTLETLLNTSDVAPRVYVPVRKVISMVYMSQRHSSTTVATPKATTTVTSAPSESLPELLVHLLQRIIGEQKQETIDFMKMLEQYRLRIAEQRDVIIQESTKVKFEESNQLAYNRQIDDATSDRTKAEAEIVIQGNALALETIRCHELEAQYFSESMTRFAELDNVWLLRSLLRVLQDSDLPKCSNDCTNVTQGKCTWKGSFGKDSFCVCTAGFYGDSCELKKCPGPDKTLKKHSERGVCSDRGKCIYEEGADNVGSCTCQSGSYHDKFLACENKVCPGDGNCLNKGFCNKSTGTCTCFDKYYGGSCSYHKCGSSNGNLYESASPSACNGNGACNVTTGACACGEPFFGSTCQYQNCPSNCNGNGTCSTNDGSCACKDGFNGAKCQFKACPNNCSNNGTCDPNSGSCTCAFGGSGPSCQPAQQCTAATLNFMVSTPTFLNNKSGWDQCPNGTYVVGMTRGASESLYGLVQFKCAAPCEADKAVTGVTRRCATQNWWASFDKAGLSTCDNNMYVVGLWKNDNGPNNCSSLYCLEAAMCCDMPNTESTDCRVHDWVNSEGSSGYFEAAGSYTIGSTRFLQGFYRSADVKDNAGKDKPDGLHNIEKVQTCGFRRVATSTRG